MTTVFLDRDAVVTAGSIAFEAPLTIRDEGLLQSAVARPQATAFGLDAYDTLWGKAAALMQSLATNHPFVDGNKRTAWQSAYVFLGINGVGPTVPLDNDKAEEFVLDVAESRLTDWVEISVVLEDLYTMRRK
ncbi:type II toxin-antitoxin system death-on-curing family toxin [Gordonia sihwensis]|uniref:type II toxin-antitoxin system death-on-curing family toxin n=1 Tax=Gordonia sihwensis TaxID=173559 RepID=UPI003D95BFB1